MTAAWVTMAFLAGVYAGTWVQFVNVKSTMSKLEKDT